MKSLVILIAVIATVALGGMIGGFTQLDVTDKEIKGIARKGLNAVQLKLKTNSILSLVDIVSARVQIVAGENYEVVIDTRPETCDVCEITRCSVNVFMQPWLHKETVTVKDCQQLPPRSSSLKVQTYLEKMADKKIVSALKLQPALEYHAKAAHEPLEDYTPGEYEFIDGEDRHVLSAANFAVEAINKRSNALFRHVFLRVTDAEHRAEMGVSYKLTIKMASSSCRNNVANYGASAKQCRVKLDEVEICKVTVVDRMWMSPRYLLREFSCAPLYADKLTGCDRQEFEAFKTRHGRLYQTQAEDGHRFSVFCANMKKAKLYEELDEGDAKYGATKFADMTEEEFKSHLSPEWDLTGNDGMTEATIPKPRYTLFSFDWRTKGAVTAVKNQGSCGSCWAFSTTGNVEGQWAIKNKKLYSLSEQELVDCDKVDKGCGGGLPSNAYDAIMKLGGLETEKEYPYEGKNDKCEFNKTEAVVKLTGSVKISKNETDIAVWLAANGPISIGINAFAMQFYFGGISHPWRIFCNPSSLDHGVLIVGYGIKGSEPYWIIKNSWGPDWGEQGYYLIYRGDGSCGLNTMCTSAVV